MNWNDIETLDLCMDTEYDPIIDKRIFGRLTQEDIERLINEKNRIQVKISTFSGTFSAHLKDISGGGILIHSPNKIPTDTNIKVGILLGDKKIITKGIVRHSIKLLNSYRIGVEFIKADPNDVEYIKELYTQKILIYGI